MFNMIEKEFYNNIGIDSYKKNAEKTTKNPVSQENTQQTTQEENNIAYKVEISSMASSLKSNSKDFEDIKSKIEDIKSKISKGTYEVDSGKIVQGLLKYFS